MTRFQGIPVDTVYPTGPGVILKGVHVHDQTLTRHTLVVTS